MKAIFRWWQRRTPLQRVPLLTAVAVVVVVAILAPSPKHESSSTSTTPPSTLAFGGLPAASSSSVPLTSISPTTTSLITTTVSSSTGTAVAASEVRVVSVIDGDTMVVAMPGRSDEQVRLIGIDSPESGERFSSEATQALDRLVRGGTVRLETDVETRDQYDRLLAYIWVGAVMANAELLRQGLATLYTVPPNIRYQEVLQVAQDEAQCARAGVWGEPSESPLRIVAVEYDAPGDDSLNLNEEYVTFEVLVGGTLLGYSVEDETGHRFRFPDLVFARGDVIRLLSGVGKDTKTDLHWGASGAAIWNNDGDTVKVLDPSDRIVASYQY
ncbi:MAG: thermonuclease family protein [Armatimonadetes bacterium]|nr:thermonuclease family protein [Armatimonadota bacterium]